MKEEVLNQYKENKEEINSRINSFRKIKHSTEYRKFQELVFVLLTSQSSAKDSWKSVKQLDSYGLLKNGEKTEIVEVLENNNIQYPGNKADFILENTEKLSQPTLANPQKKLKISQRIEEDDLDSTRKWFAKNIKGFSWKASSHFLRNIGYVNSFAIISKHTIRQLIKTGYLESDRQPSNYEEYLEAEERMKDFASDTGLELDQLDLTLWSLETGEIFK